MLYENYQYVDSVLYADSVAYAFAGYNYNTTYYNKFWELANNFTIHLFRNASYRLTCVIYTAWINSGVTNVISEKDSDLLSGYFLAQNYPNPFNPSTNIQYRVSGNSQVILKVYDILGNEVRTLVNEYRSAGIYEVEFDASLLPSGIYFYSLQAGNFLETKKMILIK